MTEMRWVIRDGERQLQYRYAIGYDALESPKWSAWVVVPEVYV
jgi:hypothetical protein